MDTRQRIGFKYNSPTNEETNEVEDVDDLFNIMLGKESDDKENKEFGDTKCLKCGSLFFKKNHRHKFCQTSCRMTYWENKNGKELKRGKVE